MAIFSKTTKKEVKPKVEKTTKAKVAKVKAPKAEVRVSTGNAPTRKDFLQGVIVRPRITEKATVLAEKNNVYVFEVNENASKPLIAKSIISLYNVVPTKIAIVRNPAKSVVVRGRLGVSGGVKKAYIYLKKGEKIEFA